MLLSVISLSLISLTWAAPLASGSAGFLKIPLRRNLTQHHTDDVSALHRRASPEQPLDFIGYRYLLDYEIAGQNITAILDTGSATVWTYNKNFSKNGYDPSLSSNRSTKGRPFSQYYGDGSYGMTGTWFEDDVTLAGVSVDYPFGLINNSNFNGFGPWGIFGFGPREGEGLGNNSYPTYMERLVEQGSIATNAFSMYVSNQDQNTAELLIGGVDTAKYTGPLYTVPFDTHEPGYGKTFWSLNFTFEGHSYTGGILDTGNPTVNLPQSVVDDLARRFGCWWSSKNGDYELIDLPKSDGLVFEIGGINVTIPIDSLFLPSYEKNGHQVYWFTVRPNLEYGGSPENLLGDPFLRQLFYTIDVDKETFGFAPVRYTSDSNVVAIPPSGIPGGQAAPIQYTSAPTYAGESNSTRATNSQCQLVDAC